ncbi:TetR/AcrR family transcriptional regulator [Gordonia sp. ABSL1-1]|uniref:TetR/AcrR family transcriptional regulator n=1 Tax=Gordonia sp. ABSL1-1 TaxID=3053923 RepID=UPI002573E9B1|nr:TetR/AcrR family transcriptional regulator [Gordonia sp. ABSL1-1]MDL9937420.1 TetR/AcrR family transcriptional regulator [Gordonia sp. ABSL1-1]
MASPTSRTHKSRAENRAEIETAIRRLGREHLSRHGAAGLSLRAIARELGMVSSAVYRYVPSRDDLLTVLVVEAYTDLADAAEAAADAVEPTDHRGRIRACALAMRDWAVSDPARWALLYGSPVPGYAAPAEQTVGPGTRLSGRLLRELDAADLSTRIDQAQTSTLRADLAAIRDEFGVHLSDAAIVAGTTLWATIIGAISLEAFGQYGADTFGDPRAVFDDQLTIGLRTVFAETR